MTFRGSFACAALACLALAGCGGGGDGGSGGSVTLQLFGDAEELQVYRDLTAAYERKTGDKVKLIEVADREAHLQKLTTAFSGGVPPSVFLINYRNYGGYASRNVLDPAGARLDSSAALERDAFFPQALEAFTFGGELKCMPQNVSSLVVYYNRDLFREAGLKDPARDWTLKDFRAAAAKLSQGDRDGVGVEPGVVRVAPFVWAAGGELVDDPSSPTRFKLDTPEAKRGLQNFLELDAFSPDEQEVASKSLDERFLDGEIAMFMSSRREVPTFRTIKDFDWDVAAFPRIDKPVGVLHSDAYCLSKGSNADAAWKFVEFAVGSEGAAITAKGGRTVPSLKDVAGSDAFLDPKLKPRSSQVFLDAVSGIRRLPISPSWPQVEDAANLAFEEAFYKQMSVEALIERIASETTGKF